MADSVSNDGTVAGTFLDRSLMLNGETLYSACTWKNKALTSLGLNPNFGIDELTSSSQGSSAGAITPDGQ